MVDLRICCKVGNCVGFVCGCVSCFCFGVCFGCVVLWCVVWLWVVLFCCFWVLVFRLLNLDLLVIGHAMVVSLGAIWCVALVGCFRLACGFVGDFWCGLVVGYLL